MTKSYLLKLTFLCLCAIVTFTTFTLRANDSEQPTQYDGWELIWSDEFNIDGKPNTNIWDAETGFQRNEEAQWYNGFKNTTCEDGKLKIEGRIERVKNPNYVAGSSDWKKNREYAEYTSSSITTGSSKSWLYGRVEVSAKIPTATGSWPAIWLLGINKEWPSNGEIDIMEFYLVGGAPNIMANAAWGTNDRWVAKWDGSQHKYSEISAGNPNWDNEFHLWRMDWDRDFIRIYLDGRLLNEIDLSQTINPDGFNPFHQPQYLLLNLALGGNGGTPDRSKFPLIYEVDYARIYQKIISYERPTQTPVNGSKYFIKHISNYFLGEEKEDETNITTLTEPTGKADQQFKFISVEGEKDKFYLQQVSSGLYLYGNGSFLDFTEDPNSIRDKGSAMFSVITPIEDEKYIVLKVNDKYIGTDIEYEAGSRIVRNISKEKQRSAFWELLQVTSEVGKIALMDEIDAAKVFLNTAVRGDEPGQYPSDKVDALMTKLIEAETMNNQDNATQEEVDTKTAELKEALSACQESINMISSDPEVIYNIIHKSGYYLGVKGENAGIAKAAGNNEQQFKFIPVNGESNTYYILHVASNKYLSKNSYNTTWSDSPSSKFQLNIGSGNTVKIKYTDTNKYIGTDSMEDNSTVYADKDGNDEKHFWSIRVMGALDFSALDMAIIKAELYKGLTLFIGDKEGEVSQAEYNALSNKITTAKNLDRSQMNEADITAQTEILTEAINTFVNALKSELSELVDEAEELNNSAVVGYLEGQYPAAAKTAFERSLNIARQTLNSTNSYQPDFNEGVEALKEAIEIFKASVNKEDMPEPEDPDTNNENIENNNIIMYTSNNTLFIEGLESGENISIYTTLGVSIYNGDVESASFTKTLPAGAYIVKIAGNTNTTQVVIVK